MYTVIESPEFIDWSAKVWSDEERWEFIDWIADNALAGDVIPGGGQFAQGALEPTGYGQAWRRKGDLLQSAGQWGSCFTVGLCKGQV